MVNAQTPTDWYTEISRFATVEQVCAGETEAKKQEIADATEEFWEDELQREDDARANELQREDDARANEQVEW
jgi:hypothetical protein